MVLVSQTLGAKLLVLEGASPSHSHCAVSVAEELPCE